MGSKVRVTPPEGQTFGIAVMNGLATGSIRLALIGIAGLITGVSTDIFWFAILVLISTGFSIKFK